MLEAARRPRSCCRSISSANAQPSYTSGPESSRQRWSYRPSWKIGRRWPAWRRTPAIHGRRLTRKQLKNWSAAAGAYDRAARQSLASDPAAGERAAELYEHAAQLYDIALADDDLERSRLQAKRLRRLPEITVWGSAQASFVEYEWDTLNLLIQNTGYRPATQRALDHSGVTDGFARSISSP